MSDTKTEALEIEASGSTKTYTTWVRPHQLRRGDVFREVKGKNTRAVVIESVTHGEITYRGHLAPVLFVNGFDHGRKVTLTKTEWEFMQVDRIGDAPTFARVNRSLDQFVY